MSIRLRPDMMSQEPFDREKQILQPDRKRNFWLFEPAEKLKLNPTLCHHYNHKIENYYEKRQGKNSPEPVQDSLKNFNNKKHEPKTVHFERSKIKSINDLDVKTKLDPQMDMNYLQSFKYRCEVKSMRDQIFADVDNDLPQVLAMKKSRSQPLMKKNLMENNFQTDFTKFKHSYMKEHYLNNQQGQNSSRQDAALANEVKDQYNSSQGPNTNKSVQNRMLGIEKADDTQQITSNTNKTMGNTGMTSNMNDTMNDRDLNDRSQMDKSRAGFGYKSENAIQEDDQEMFDDNKLSKGVFGDGNKVDKTNKQLFEVLDPQKLGRPIEQLHQIDVNTEYHKQV